jgi:hypothetical protein
MSDQLFERAVRDWLDDGSDKTPPTAIEAVLLAAKTTPQERVLGIPRRRRGRQLLRRRLPVRRHSDTDPVPEGRANGVARSLGLAVVDEHDDRHERLDVIHVRALRLHDEPSAALGSVARRSRLDVRERHRIMVEHGHRLVLHECRRWRQGQCVGSPRDSRHNGGFVDPVLV